MPVFLYLIFTKHLLLLLKCYRIWPRLRHKQSSLWLVTGRYESLDVGAFIRSLQSRKTAGDSFDILWEMTGEFGEKRSFMNNTCFKLALFSINLLTMYNAHFTCREALFDWFGKSSGILFCINNHLRMLVFAENIVCGDPVEASNIVFLAFSVIAVIYANSRKTSRIKEQREC